MSARSSFRPYMFRSLGPEPEETAQTEAVVAEPPPPVFSESDVVKARAEARQEGFIEGLEVGKTELDREQAERQKAATLAAGALAVQFDALVERHDRFFATQGPLLTQIAVAVARRVAGHALRTEPTAEIESMISRCLNELADKQPLKVFVHPGIIHLIEASYAEKAKLRPQDTQRLIFAADDRLNQLDDCRIEWPSGMLERNQADSWGRIEVALAAFDPAAPEPTTPEPAHEEPISVPEPNDNDQE